MKRLVRGIHNIGEGTFVAIVCCCGCWLSLGIALLITATQNMAAMLHG